MSVLQLIYVSAPPQYLRELTIWPAIYQVGDRLPYAYGNGFGYGTYVDVWVCTQAGTLTYSAIPSLQFSSPYSAGGTSIWAREPVTGWANSLPWLPRATPNVYLGSPTGARRFGLIDADWVGPEPYGNFSTTVDYACVDVVTGTPRAGVYGPPNDRSRAYYGDIASGVSTRGGSRLLHANRKLGTMTYAIDCKATVPSTRLPASGTGVKGVFTRISLPGNVSPLNYAASGIGVYVDAPDVPPGTAITYNSAGLAFTNFPRVTPAPEPNKAEVFSYTYVGTRNLYKTTQAYGGSSVKPDPPTLIGGHNCVMQEVTHTYRTGAAPAGLPARSFRFMGVPNAGSGMWTSGYIHVVTPLTGARTVTVKFLTNSPHRGSFLAKDIWMEIFYPEVSTGPYILATTEDPNWGVPGIVSTPVPEAAVAWTTGVPDSWTFELTKAITIGRAGMIAIRILVASNKIGPWVTYVDPYVSIT